MARTHNTSSFPALIAGTALLCVAFLMAWNHYHAAPRSLDAYAAEVMTTCASATPHSSCYDRELPKLSSVLSMEDILGVTKIIQSKDSSYWFCHLLAHSLSEKEYEKTGGDWRGVLERCPVGMCSNGCIHGVLQKHFAVQTITGAALDDVLPELKNICEPRAQWDPTEQQRSSCYHELGHIALYLENGDPAPAQHICDVVAVKPDGRNYLQTCYEGLFMQIFQPIEPDDFGLIYPLVPNKTVLPQCDAFQGEAQGVCWRKGWEGHVLDFCSQFKGEFQGACMREGWVAVGANAESPKTIVDYCSYTNDIVQQNKCYNVVFYTLLSRFSFDETKMETLCHTLPSSIQGQCFANTASRLIETDASLQERSLAVCNRAASIGFGESCYRELDYYAGFLYQKGSPDFNRLCSGIPDSSKNNCHF